MYSVIEKAEIALTKEQGLQFLRDTGKI